MADMDNRVSKLETQTAVLETKIATIQGDFAESMKTLKELSADIHAIREMIATGKGYWWGAAGVVSLLAVMAGGTGALVHRITSGQ